MGDGWVMDGAVAGWMDTMKRQGNKIHGKYTEKYEMDANLRHLYLGSCLIVCNHLFIRVSWGVTGPLYQYSRLQRATAGYSAFTPVNGTIRPALASPGCPPPPGARGSRFSTCRAMTTNDDGRTLTNHTELAKRLLDMSSQLV